MEYSYHNFIDDKFISKITSWIYKNMTHCYPNTYKGWINLLGSQFKYCFVTASEPKPISVNIGKHYVDPHLLMERLRYYKILVMVDNDIYIGLKGLNKRKILDEGCQAFKKIKIF